MTFIDSTIGASEIGLLVSMFLFGIITLQTLVYFQRFPKDGMVLKTMVSTIWIFELAHTILTSMAVYQMTITFYGRPLAFLVHKGFPIFQVTILPSAMIQLIIETFFIIRLWRLLRQPILTGICSILALLGFTDMLVIAAFSIREPNFMVFNQKWQWLVELNLGAGVALDILLCASLSWYLFKNRRETISKDTVRMLDKLIYWTIQTGLSTVLTAVLMTLFYKLKPETMIWNAISMSLPKVFSNQLLGTLNSRALSQNLVATEHHPSSIRSRIAHTETEGLTTEIKSETKNRRTTQLCSDEWSSTSGDRLELKVLP